MADPCGKLSENILIDCDNPLVAGADDRLVLVNKCDWDDATITRDGANNQLITNIVLATGDIAYYFEGKNNSVEPRNALAKQKYAEVYDHEVIFKVFKSNAATKQQIELMAKGKMVAIIQNNYKGAAGEACFEVYGEETGLLLMEMERAIMDAETQGAFNLTLRTAEDIKEGHLPATLYDTNFATTKAIVDGLLT